VNGGGGMGGFQPMDPPLLHAETTSGSAQLTGRELDAAVIPDALAARALAHPIRARTLEALAAGPASPRQIAHGLGEPLGTVSYHVQALLRMGLIELLETLPRRGAIEHRYRAVVRVRVTIEPL
jgi:DNA-binding transcriptional ArsR family regulator